MIADIVKIILLLVYIVTDIKTCVFVAQQLLFMGLRLLL